MLFQIYATHEKGPQINASKSAETANRKDEFNNYQHQSLEKH